MATFRSFREWLKVKTVMEAGAPAAPGADQKQLKTQTAASAAKALKQVVASSGNKNPADVLADPAQQTDIAATAIKDVADTSDQVPDVATAVGAVKGMSQPKAMKRGMRKK